MTALGFASVRSGLYVMQGDDVTVGLFYIDPTTGAWTQVGSSNWVNTRLMTALGSSLYVMQGDDTTMGLFRIDPTTGAWTQVGSSNWANTTLMTAVCSSLYVMQGDNTKMGLFRIDPTTGAWTQVGSSNWVNTSLMTALDSSLYVMQDNGQNRGLFRIDPTTGSWAQVGGSNWQGAFIMTFGGGTGEVNPNLTSLENRKPGTSAWQLSDPATNGEIEGYASLTSVNRGGQIQLFVNTTDPDYTIEIYRMGWYQGLGARLLLGPITLAGTAQVIPTVDHVTGLVECNWTNPYLLTIPNNPPPSIDWCSGVYLAKLTGTTSGKQSYINFVVRDDTRSSDYLFVRAVNTEQAYNRYGRESLYRSFDPPPPGHARKVSFNRPDIGDASIVSNGAGMYFSFYDYNMIRFLERECYDLAYCTNVDIHESCSVLLSHKALLFVGHDEYWSKQMRSNVEAARDNGIGLGFFCANSCYWQVRFEPSPVTGYPDRTIVCYKDDLDDPMRGSAFATVKWRDPPLNLPEDALLGVMFDAQAEANLVVSDALHWAYNCTGVHNGDQLTAVLGYETDRMFGNAPANTQRIAHSPLAGTYADVTVYQAPSGATVFAAGSIQWSWGLDDYNVDSALWPRTSRLDARVVQMTRNVLARLIGAR